MSEHNIEFIPGEQQCLRTIATMSRQAMLEGNYDPADLFKRRVEVYGDVEARIVLTNLCAQMLKYSAGLLEALLDPDLMTPQLLQQMQDNRYTPRFHSDADSQSQ